ncbi:unnamed protein product [Leptidea sinapis]|uniref:Amino acid transporter transmembrane domain-containing protein n=1 Tax=Leptidea sinapis TaxID=189913 RepID=A0A5E4QJ35_9NEOP|nr:unnamed protein product [Leptidea sinapis]
MGTTGQSITLANSIIGVGILAMPFCFQQCGVLLATLILLSMGLVSRLCCYFLLKSAIITRRRNYEFLAFHVFGPSGKLAVEVGIIGFLMGTCIAYFVVVGDLGPQIIAKMLNINQSDILRTSIMVIVSLVCVLPLGLLRNVDSLSNVSAATIAFYFCLVMKVISDAGTQLLADDWHNRLELWKPSGLLQCVPIFSMALFCQTQLFEIFESMPSLSLEKMSVVTKNAINICTGVYFTLGVFGYVAFGSKEISGNILMSLSPTMASDVIKLGFVMSLAFSFPLIIFPCRASLYSFLYRKVHPAHHDHIINHSIPEHTFRCMTVAIIAVSLFISLLIPNIELVLGLVGSTIGVLICVVFPAACFVNVTFKNTNERVLAKFTVIFGLIILVLGTFANLQAAENTRDKYFDEKYITQERIDKIVEDFFQKMEKSDESVKPQASVPIIVKMNTKDNIEKDSVVLPPNPIPPDSQPLENKLAEDASKKIVGKQQIKEDKIEILPNDKEVVNKVSEENNIPPPDPKKVNGKLQPIPKLEEKVQSNQESLDIKQQQLIETIKQHGEEQKELIKEQKEILDELIKTKKEIEKNKEEKDSNEAKKIAVESIQKIANVAIQSLTGVSDSPGQNVDAVKLKENIAKNAVNDIAKAVEALDTIKKTNEKDDHKIRQEINELKLKKQHNLIPAASVLSNSQDNKQNIKIHDLKSVEQNNIVKTSIPEIVRNGDIPQKKVQNKIVESIQENKQSIPPIENKIKPDNQERHKENSEANIRLANQQFKSLDEPKSYKEGKGAQKVKEENKVGSMPLVIALSEKSKSQKIQTENDIKNNNDIAKPIPSDGNLYNEIKDRNIKKDTRRQKREVVTVEDSLDNNKICNKVAPDEKLHREINEILPKVDLNDVLSKNLPIPALDVHHIRSLKSIEPED